jgi:DUF4097 and DUF4098 domain-containing protein YvlB
MKFEWTMMILLLCSQVGCNSSINETMRVADGETVQGDMNSVNGAIIIGEHCQVQGTARTVNGSLNIGRHSSVAGLQSVNGAIEVQETVNVYGDIGSVNGPVVCKAGVEISGQIGTVNGPVTLEKTLLGRNIETSNGAIVLRAGSKVLGNIIISGEKDKPDGSRKALVIRLEDQSTVVGDIVVADHERLVEVHISGGSQVLGSIQGAEVIE